MTATEAWALSSGQVWSVRMTAADTLSVESINLYVTSSKSKAWTIQNIKYMGKEIVGDTFGYRQKVIPFYAQQGT